MKAALLLSLFCASAVGSFADEFRHDTAFKSTDAFVASAKAFKPDGSKSDLTKFFTIIEEEGVTQPATADSIDSCDLVFEDDTQAIIFVTAQPPTLYTIWKIGVLFYLVHESGKWHISDVRRFDAQNRECRVACELTSGEKTHAVVTVTVTRGRRDWTYSVSASYSPDGKKLVRRDPEQE